MTRQRMKLAYISNESARKATFKKRKKGIMKKVSELSTLCGIQACAIISSPFDSQTEVWPDPEGAQQVIERYQNTAVRDESKNVNQESFIMQRIAKATTQLKKQRKENHEKEMTLAMFQIIAGKTQPENLTMADLKDINMFIERNMKDVEKKMASLC